MDYQKETIWIVETWSHSEDAEEREKARQKIINLNDNGFFEPMKATLESAKDKNERSTLYFMFRRLLRNTEDSDIGQYMMDRIAKTKKKTEKVQLLDGISLSQDTNVRIMDARNAIDCLNEKMKHLQGAAVEALGSCGDPAAELALIELLDKFIETRDAGGWDIYHAVRSLSYVATKKSLPTALSILENIDKLRVKTRKQEIKAMAVKTIVKLAPQKHRDLLCQLIKDKMAMVRWQAMKGLSLCLTKNEAPAITKRITAILSSKRILPQTEGPFFKPEVADILFLATESAEAKMTELLFGLMALKKVGLLDQPALTTALKEKWSALVPPEQAYLIENVEGFADMTPSPSNQ